MNQEKEIKLSMDSTLDKDEILQDEIPFDEIKNPQSINKAKTNPNILKKITEEIGKKFNIPNGVAKALIFGNLHTGGTASKASPTHSFTLSYRNTEYFLDLSTLRNISEKVSISTGQKFTLRQLARTHENEILLFASRLNLPGNLSKKFIQMDATLENEQLIYAADYVDPSNTTLSEKIKNLLTLHKNNKLLKNS
nr:hypothetical protein [Caulerpa lentillifera]